SLKLREPRGSGLETNHRSCSSRYSEININSKVILPSSRATKTVEMTNTNSEAITNKNFHHFHRSKVSQALAGGGAEIQSFAPPTVLKPWIQRWLFIEPTVKPISPINEVIRATKTPSISKPAAVAAENSTI